LECLVELHKVRPVLFRKLKDKSEGQRSTFEYPFAVAGVNITFELIQMLHLSSPTASANAPHVIGFLNLLEAREDAFILVYCLMFELLDKTWLDIKASYMEFPSVMKQYPSLCTLVYESCCRITKKKIEYGLSTKPRSINDLRRVLSL